MLIAILAIFIAASSASAVPAFGEDSKLTLDDLVSVIPTCEGSRQRILAATRSWRFGIRTFIATNASAERALFQSQLYGGPGFRETYAHFPDETYITDPVTNKKQRFHGARAGDWRSAISPFLAHAHYVAANASSQQRYKWMLYGRPSRSGLLSPCPPTCSRDGSVRSNAAQVPADLTPPPQTLQ